MDPELKAQLEKDTLAKLKKMGFPAIEAAATSMSILPKAVNCLTRRLQTLGPVLLDVEKAVKAEAAQESKRGEDSKTRPESFISKRLSVT